MCWEYPQCRNANVSHRDEPTWPCRAARYRIDSVLSVTRIGLAGAVFRDGCGPSLTVARRLAPQEFEIASPLVDFSAHGP
jgi:hypothetical protein